MQSGEKRNRISKLSPKTCVFFSFFLIFPTFYFTFTFVFQYNRLGFPRRVQGRPSPRCTSFHYLMFLHQIVTRPSTPPNLSTHAWPRRVPVPSSSRFLYCLFHVGFTKDVAVIHEDVQKRRRDRTGPRSTKKGKEGNRESRHEKTDMKGTDDRLY